MLRKRCFREIIKLTLYVQINEMLIGYLVSFHIALIYGMMRMRFLPAVITGVVVSACILAGAISAFGIESSITKLFIAMVLLSNLCSGIVSKVVDNLDIKLFENRERLLEEKNRSKKLLEAIFPSSLLNA